MSKHSLFSMQLDAAMDYWVSFLPPSVHESFRADLRRFGSLHEGALNTLEAIWERRERTYRVDHPTGLVTRGPFHELLTGFLSEAQLLTGSVVGVLFIDLNNLKRINDACGHAAGDAALAAVGGIVRDALRVGRGVDAVGTPGDRAQAVGRQGGDEFVAALKLDDARSIEPVATRIKRRVDDVAEQRAHGYAGSVPVTVAVGAVAYETTAEPPDTAPNHIATALLSAADGLMYKSKRDHHVHVASARFGGGLEVYDDRRVAVND